MSTNISKKGILSITRDEPGVTWGPWSAIIIALLVFIVVQLIAAEIVLIYPHLQGWSSGHANSWLTNSVIAQFFYVLLAETLTVFLIIAFIRWRKGKIQAIGLRRPKREDPLYALLGLAIYFPLYIAIVAIISGLIPSLNINQTQDVGFNGTYHGWQLLLVFLSLVALPPIAEEIMFRGFLFSGLKKSLPVVWAAIFTSLLFAIPHLLESSSGGALWIAGIDTFILSTVLCWLRQKTGRLYAGMGLHGLKNFIAFAFLFLLHVH
ncbi:MAG TPA: CPBP family intramembrane glutamic endopeptidase [Candidatus Saccharimonadales bacterium]|nr:CPBP family intramembrane glutamic endopeptidase [Candidatus Saccharimonadales bacterium]